MQPCAIPFNVYRILPLSTLARSLSFIRISVNFAVLDAMTFGGFELENSDRLSLHIYDNRNIHQRDSQIEQVNGGFFSSTC